MAKTTRRRRQDGFATFGFRRAGVSARRVEPQQAEPAPAQPEPQVISPALKGAEKNIGPIIKDGACTNCGRCIDVCAQDVFPFGLRFDGKSKTNRPAS